jgi:hypothetical protein
MLLATREWRMGRMNQDPDRRDLGRVRHPSDRGSIGENYEVK